MERKERQGTCLVKKQHQLWRRGDGASRTVTSPHRYSVQAIECDGHPPGTRTSSLLSRKVLKQIELSRQFVIINYYPQLCIERGNFAVVYALGLNGNNKYFRIIIKKDNFAK